MHNIAQLKQALPLDSLMCKLGHGELVKKSATCPFHQDKRNSFSVFSNGTGESYWKCHAGCGNGDALDFVKTFFDLPSTKAAIAKYADLAGMSGAAAWEAVRKFQGKVAPAKVVAEPKPPGPPAKLEPLTPAAALKIAQWRGLEPSFVLEMSDKGILGLYDNKPAFKADGGVQYRVPGDGWRYSAGAKASLLMVMGTSDKVYIVESCWDALAIHEATGATVLCTRGASNARLAIDYIEKAEGASFIAVPHNDPAGDNWTQDLQNGLMLHDLQVRRVPQPYKDANDYYKANKK